MFKIKYKLKIDNEEYESEYPEPSDTGHNIFILKGKNDSGKTTLISLIKLAFIKDLDSIKDSPGHEKLEFLLNNTEFEATLNIASYNKDTKVDIVYDNKEWKTKGQIKADYILNGDIAGYTTIQDKIDVLYEVPSAPLDKLKNVLTRIREDFKDYKENCRNYKDDLGNLYTEIKNYNEREDKRNIINKKIQELEGELESKRKYCGDLESKFNTAENLYYSYKYKDLKYKLDQKNRELEQIKNDKSNMASEEMPKGEVIKLQGQLVNNIREAKVWLTYLGQIIDNFSPEFKEFRKDLNEFNEIEYNNIATIKSKYIIDKLISEIEMMRKSINTKIQNEDEKKIQYQLLKELKELLNKYKNTDPTIPGLGESVVNILQKLDAEENQFKKIKQYENIIDKLDETDKNIQNLNNFVKKNSNVLINVSLTQRPKWQEREQHIKSLEAEIDSIKNELREIPPKYENSDIDTFIQLDDVQPRYEKLKKDIEIYKKITEGIETELNTQRALLKEYSTLSKPSTTLTLEEIQSKIKKLETIMSRLSEYIRYIDSLKKRKPIENGEKEKKFYDALGEYLAAGLIREIYHNHQLYPIKQINLIERFYVFESGERIPFDAIGSGTSALNSILMKIKQTDNKKKIIALIDEIGAMDDENFKTFLEGIKEYTTEGRLFLTIMTRPDSSVDKAVCEPVKLGDGFD